MRGLFDWCFRDRRTGAVVIGQAPNLALWLFAAASLAAWLIPPGGTAGHVAFILSRLVLAWWAADELLRGVNPWRRFLGAAVLIYLLARALL